MAPEGTVRVTLVAVAAVSVAIVAPKNTPLSVAVVIKLVPVKVTASSGLALIGLNEVIVGGISALRNTETVFELPFVTAKSGLPSPSKSPMATDCLLVQYRHYRKYHVSSLPTRCKTNLDKVS